MSLPSGYTRLEYIESTGTQYIDTGFIPNQDTRIDMVVYPTSVVDAGGGAGFVPYGSAQAYNSRAFECYTVSAQYEFNYGTTYKNIGNAVIGQKVAITHNKNNVSLSINDGQLLTTSFIYSSFTTPYTMTLFGTHRSSVLCGQQKIYSCQIRDNGHLIRNFIPCKNTNGVVGLWDDVNSSFYSNAGSGTFIAGLVVSLGGIFGKVNGVCKQIDNVTVNVR